MRGVFLGGQSDPFPRAAGAQGSQVFGPSVYSHSVWAEFVPNGPRLVVVATLGWRNGPLLSTRPDDDDDDVWARTTKFGLVMHMGMFVFCGCQPLPIPSWRGTSAPNFSRKALTYVRILWPRMAKFGVVAHMGGGRLQISIAWCRPMRKFGISLFTFIQAATISNQWSLPKVDRD